MGEGAEVDANRGRSPCLSQGVTTLGNACRGQVSQGICSKALAPPLELIWLVIAHVGAFVGQDFPRVAIKSLSKGVACRFSTGEVAAFQDSTFSHLCPFASV